MLQKTMFLTDVHPANNRKIKKTSFLLAEVIPGHSGGLKKRW
jgi:hypothetical protein